MWWFWWLEDELVVVGGGYAALGGGAEGGEGIARERHGSITAGCGLCWAMPFSGDALAAFRAATEGRITPADYHQLVL